MAKGAVRRINTLGICVTVSAFLKHVLATPPYARTKPPAPSLMPPKYLLVFCGGGLRNGEMSFINQIEQTEVFEVGAHSLPSSLFSRPFLGPLPPPLLPYLVTTTITSTKSSLSMAERMGRPAVPPGSPSSELRSSPCPLF